MQKVYPILSKIVAAYGHGMLR